MFGLIGALLLAVAVPNVPAHATDTNPYLIIQNGTTGTTRTFENMGAVTNTHSPSETATLNGPPQITFEDMGGNFIGVEIATGNGLKLRYSNAPDGECWHGSTDSTYPVRSDTQCREMFAQERTFPVRFFRTIGMDASAVPQGQNGTLTLRVIRTDGGVEDRATWHVAPAQQQAPGPPPGQCQFPPPPDRTTPTISVIGFNLTTRCTEFNTFAHGSEATFVSSLDDVDAEFFFTPKHDIKSVSYAVTGTMNLASLSPPGDPQQCPEALGLAGQTVMASDSRVCTFTPTNPITTADFATRYFVALLIVPDIDQVATLTVAVTYVDGSATPSESFTWNVKRTLTAAPQQQQQQGSTAPQLPVVLSPQGVARAIATPGSVWGMIGGKPATTIVNAPTVGQLNAQIGTVELSLTAPEVNGSPLSGGGFVAKGGDLDIAATGFFPFSAVRVWSVSEQRLLATSVVSADGTVDLDVTLPDRPNACRETVQISGSNASAEQIAASLTLRYALDNPFANETGAAEIHAGALACLANRGVMSGVSADHAAADRVITRAQVAALITRALELTGQTASVSDVNQNVHQDAIRAAIAAGLFTPFEDGTFRPDMPVTRAELARIVATAANLEPAETTSFTDMNGETARLAEALRQAGIVRGTTDARFNPDQFATRAQTASIIDNLLALIESTR